MLVSAAPVQAQVEDASYRNYKAVRDYFGKPFADAFKGISEDVREKYILHTLKTRAVKVPVIERDTKTGLVLRVIY